MKRFVLLTLVAAAAAACSDGAGPDGPSVSLSFATARPTPLAAPGFSASVMADTVTSGSDTLIITSAEIVLREIELERADRDAACDSTATNDDGCEEFETGPLLVDLPLNGQVAQALAIAIPPGTYDEIEFDIHKVSNDDPEDAAFRAEHPDFVDVSIRVQGTFNGEPFTFESDLSEEQELDLVPPLVIADGVLSTNVTVLVDLSQWFVVSSQLVNPALGNKGGDLESEIQNNIKQSIEAFEDEDSDGDDSDES